MSNDISNAMSISAYGMRAQGTRMRVISENIANADTTGLTPGADPYARKSVTFKNLMDRDSGTDLVRVSKISDDKTTPFPLKYMPDHPAADANGYVKTPNVNSLIEVMDMREAQRTYEANLGMMENARAIMNRTIDLLRG